MTSSVPERDKNLFFLVRLRKRLSVLVTGNNTGRYGENKRSLSEDWCGTVSSYFELQQDSIDFMGQYFENFV